jgi:cell division protease FtsH
MLPWSPRRFIGILLLLFAINYLVVAIFAPPKKKVRIPYSPTFLSQVRGGNVKEISSKGDTIQGDFRHQVKYKGDKAKRFDTEIPTFADDKALSRLLQQKNVVINAKPPGERSVLQTILFSFGPTILLVGLFVLLARRASGGGAEGWRPPSST